MKYTISIIETLERQIEIEAKTKEEALNKVKNKYDKEKIVLDSNDHVSTDFYLYEYNPLN